MKSTNKNLVVDAFGQAVQDGQAIARTIQEAADDLAFLMQQLHGGSYRTDVNHETGYVLICWTNKGASS